ncbi:putative metal-binding motif-containing protein [Myxococcota bacterium]|nr:putative metal-binding motif-containing protein [Myxococcota bacterium]
MQRSLVSFALVHLTLLSACFGDKDPSGDSAVDSEPVVIDEDGDGVRAEDDCDDNDASVYPGAAEPCDERDNDCDGSVDEGANASFYADGNGDGFGRDDSDVLACEAPEGYASNGGDCDDNNRDVSPDAEEVCDGADNNCDGAPDEGVTINYYNDGDGDGDGDPGAPITGCELPPEGVLSAGDCDDNDPSLNSNDADEDGLASCDGDCDDNNANHAAFCEYATLSGELSLPSFGCVFSVSGEATDPSTACPSCDFGFLSEAAQTTSGTSCTTSFSAIFAYDIDAASMKLLFAGYYELGPFPGTLSYGAGYDTLSFYGPSANGTPYEGSFTLSP